MKRLLILAVTMAMTAGCAHVGYNRVLSATGAANATDLQVRYVDLRSGSVYEGYLPRTSDSVYPVATLPVPALISGDAIGVQADAAWPKDVPKGGGSGAPAPAKK